jgi:hypothetical protein
MTVKKILSPFSMSYSPFSKFSRFEHQKMFRKYFLSTNIDKRFHVAEQFYSEPATFWILNAWMNSILQNIRTWLTSRTESCEIYSHLKNKDSEKAPQCFTFYYWSEHMMSCLY